MHVTHNPAAGLVKRSQEMKEQRDKERLEAYYKKNFKVCVHANSPAVDWAEWSALLMQYEDCMARVVAVRLGSLLMLTGRA